MEAHAGSPLAAAALDAYARREAEEQAEHARRVEARRRELEEGALSRLRQTLSSVALEHVTVLHVEAEPFDALGGSVQLAADGIEVLYEYAGAEQGARLALLVSCRTCGQKAAGDSFDDLASLGAALLRPAFVDPERHRCRCGSGSSTTAAGATLAA